MKKTNITTEVIRVLCAGLISDPKQLQIKSAESQHSRKIVVEIKCSDVDFPRILGKNKATLRALRVLAKAASRDWDHVEVLLLSPSSAERIDPLPTNFDKNWTHDKMLNDLQFVLESVFVYPPDVDAHDLERTTLFEVGIKEIEQASTTNIAEISSAVRLIFVGHGKNVGRNLSFDFYKEEYES